MILAYEKGSTFGIIIRFKFFEIQRHLFHSFQQYCWWFLLINSANRRMSIRKTKYYVFVITNDEHISALGSAKKKATFHNKSCICKVKPFLTKYGKTLLATHLWDPCPTAIRYFESRNLNHSLAKYSRDPCPTEIRFLYVELGNVVLCQFSLGHVPNVLSCRRSLIQKSLAVMPPSLGWEDAILVDFWQTRVQKS